MKFLSLCFSFAVLLLEIVLMAMIRKGCVSHPDGMDKFSSNSISSQHSDGQNLLVFDLIESEEAFCSPGG